MLDINLESDLQAQKSDNESLLESEALDADSVAAFVLRPARVPDQPVLGNDTERNAFPSKNERPSKLPSSSGTSID